MAEKCKSSKAKILSPPKRVGRISHYFTKIGVAVVEVEAPIRVGDKISIEGATTNFQQTVKSMQIQHKPIKLARKGSSIGLKVKARCREGDVVYKI